MPPGQADSSRTADPLRDAIAPLVPLVYEELRRIARRQLRSERTGHTLNTTALVHESYLKLADQTRAIFRDRTHFLAVASQAMRRILVDYARGHRALRRGGDLQRIELDELSLAATTQGGGDTLLALNNALKQLEALDPRQCRVVECRFFGGMTEEETAAALGVNERTVRRDWIKAKAWLYVELKAAENG
jgi:RNA polymerase sigma factor (TIGR02999 family)